MSVACVVASDGTLLPVSSLAQTPGYTNGNLTSLTVSYNGNTYIKTISYISGAWSGSSQWVKQ